MKITVITTFFNAESTIKETIESVAKQNYEPLEYIFVDGLSEDNSLDIVRENISKFKDAKIISEKDAGIYDGMNKGIEASTGDVIAILNADDTYNLDTLNKVKRYFLNTNADIVAGTISKFSGVNGGEQVYPRSSMQKLSPTNPSIHHPAVFVKKSVYDNIGLFDLNYEISADFDFISRAINSGVNVHYSDEVLTNMREGGASEAINSHTKKNIEHLIIGYKNRKSLSSYIKFVIFVLKKYTYGLLMYFRIKRG